jgi:RsiW-degrading membrane proteinase PrsW (M82 family)
MSEPGGIPVVEILVSLVPVLVFLGVLRFLDSYKLVRVRSLLVSIVVGCAVAGVASVVNGHAMEFLHVEHRDYSLYIAPVIEEVLKAAFVIFLISSKRVGFMVDGAIQGFAIGAGFAATENLFYLFTLPPTSMFLWLIRGLGTAMMHGATTAIVGIISKSLSDRFSASNPLVYVPGLVLAILVHAMFNHFFIPALIETVVILVVLPLLMLFVFDRSERATRHWLGVGFDTDRELLEMLTTGNLSESRIGIYLHSLQDRFRGEILADMLCLLRMYLELSISAKGLLLMREAGFEVKSDPEIREKFAELRFLEKSIGRTGKVALLPFLHTSTRDLWQLNLLGD